MIQIRLHPITPQLRQHIEATVGTVVRLLEAFDRDWPIHDTHSLISQATVEHFDGCIAAYRELPDNLQAAEDLSRGMAYVLGAVLVNACGAKWIAAEYRGTTHPALELVHFTDPLGEQQSVRLVLDLKWIRDNVEPAQDDPEPPRFSEYLYELLIIVTDPKRMAEFARSLLLKYDFVFH